MGGAIYNYATSGASALIGSITGDFIGNYIISYSSKGGAIYTYSDMSFLADGNSAKPSITFKGNYIQNGDSEKQYQAIYVDSNTATVTFNAPNQGIYNIYDYIDGNANSWSSQIYNVKFTSDGTGRVNLYNDVRNGHVTTENVTMNLSDGKVHDYQFGSLTTDENTKWVIDIDAGNRTADNIRTSSYGVPSSGKVYIDKINVFNGVLSDNIDQNFKIQILNTNSSDLQLALSDEVQGQLPTGEFFLGVTGGERTGFEYENPLTETVTWEQEFKRYGLYSDTVSHYGTVGLATTNTDNDSIGVSETRTENTPNARVFEGYDDPFKVAMQSNDVRTFKTDNPKAYIIANNSEPYTWASGMKTIEGARSENGVMSTIDLNGVNFNAYEKLSLKNLKLINGNSITYDGYTDPLTLDGVTMANNGSGLSTYSAKIQIQGNSDIQDNITLNSGSAILNVDGTDTVTLGGAIKGGITTYNAGIYQDNYTWPISSYRIHDVETGTYQYDNGYLFTPKAEGGYTVSYDPSQFVSDINNLYKLTNEWGSVFYADLESNKVWSRGENPDNYSYRTLLALDDGSYMITEQYYTFNLEQGSDHIYTNGSYYYDSANNTMWSAWDETPQDPEMYYGWRLVKIGDKYYNDNGGHYTKEAITDENRIESWDQDWEDWTQYTLTKNGDGYVDENNNSYHYREKTTETSQFNLSNGIVNLGENAQIDTMKINFDNVLVNLAKESTFSGNNDLTVMSQSALNTINDKIGTVNLNSLTLDANLNMNVDVDLANSQMDKLSAESYTFNNNSKLNISGMNLLSDATNDTTNILFADSLLASHVTSSVSEIGSGSENSFQTTAYSPIYKYNVAYQVSEDDSQGYFNFQKLAAAPGGGGSSTPTFEAVNPAVAATPVAAQSAAQVSLENTFAYSFSNSDNFMLMPLAERTALRNRNKYALAASDLPDGANPLYELNETSSAWLKPYVSFENIPLKNGPKVNVISYGSLAGYDTDLKELKRGWARAWTGFVGYNGANIHYSGVDTIQNGGLLGGTLTLYKGNFFNATTLSAGAMVGETSTMYGHENTTSILGGIGNKTGYNIEFKNGKFIVQPSVFLSYSFVKTLDYTNAAGVRIDSDPYHNIQLSPGLKFIANLKHGWQPYIGVNMVWNVMNNSHVKANNVTLPNMSVKPYIQYGIGLQKRVKENFMAYGQAMIQNGGRNGISLTAGLRWAIGRNSKSVEKVQRPTNEHKVSNKLIRRNVKNDQKKVELRLTNNGETKSNQKLKNNSVQLKQPQKVGKIRAFFAKMDGEPINQTTLTPRKAVVTKL
ncbi:autotransporter outer membrane beta-barrel domain-containing protein [bacterium]|nr:autotransporter outer membrane beta-barrel domain-containing protein [bacterium]